MQVPDEYEKFAAERNFNITSLAAACCVLLALAFVFSPIQPFDGKLFLSLAAIVLCGGLLMFWMGYRQYKPFLKM